ncbi:hypothetical protein AB852_35395 [Streptomyces uncialis]|uniref:Uncharacterized protein n=1 Tax=Streptomyces uncialis TaxID=1048205 RepID=A0A1Q4UY56_9ACTN|nr:hypothetical protein AB852_35395 [Streptomyces uncialis]
MEDNRLTWFECPHLPRELATEAVTDCEGVGAVLRAQGVLVSRLLPARYDGFRVMVRDAQTGAMVGASEWYLNPASGTYHMHPGTLWSACDYGCHGHHQGDVDGTAMAA